MNILVTGSEGYIGQQLVSFLKKRYNVYGFDKLCKLADPNNFRGNLTNKHDIIECFNRFKNINVVVHLAALSGVEKNVSEYDSYYQNNVVGTINLLETMREKYIKNIIFGSSCSVYGENKNATEDSKLNPVSIYGLTKVIGENILRYYGTAHSFNYQILRIFNVIGGDSNSDFNNKRMLPTLVRNIKNDTGVKLFLDSFSENTCVRDYVDINLLISVFDYFLNIELYNDTINVGSGVGISGQEMSNRCFDVLEKRTKIEYINKRDGDPNCIVANSEKLKRYGFNKFIDINNIIKDYAKR